MERENKESSKRLAKGEEMEDSSAGQNRSHYLMATPSSPPIWASDSSSASNLQVILKK